MPYTRSELVEGYTSYTINIYDPKGVYITHLTIRRVFPKEKAFNESIEARKKEIIIEEAETLLSHLNRS